MDGEPAGTHSNVYEITPLPCPICEKPVTSLRLTIREHASGLVDGCPECQSEVEAMKAEAAE